MRSADDKGSYNYSSSQDCHNANLGNFEFPKGNGTNKSSNQRKALGSRTKPTPSKWDDAQKWLVGLSGGGDHGLAKSKGRNSDADDMKLLRAMSQKGRSSYSSVDGGLEDGISMALAIRDPITNQDEGETKNMDCNESSWMVNKMVDDSLMDVKSIYVRDVGTEMTPIASQEPSRTATPLRATTPMLTSPIASRPSSPGRCRQGAQHLESYQTGTKNLEGRNEAVGFGRANGNGWSTRRDEDGDGCKIIRHNDPEQIKNLTLESRAIAWDEAERAKYMARYRREEVKIQAWENHEKRKAEMEMKRIEVKAERLKSRAQERLSNKVAATRRIAEEKRANAETKLNEHAARTTEKAEYIRRTGHLPSSFFSFNLPSLCG